MLLIVLQERHLSESKSFIEPKKRPHLLVVSSVWPHVAASFEAANVVSHAMVSELERSAKFDITYAYVNTSSAAIPEKAQVEVDALKCAGVNFVELIISPPPALRQRPWLALKALFGNAEKILSGYGDAPLLQKVVEKRIDAVLTVWTEVGLNTASTLSAMRFAYHGNPDHKVFDAQHEMLRLVGAQPSGWRGALDGFRRILLRTILERAHLSVLRRYKLVADVAANDAAYYSAQGVNAHYLCNMWPMRPAVDWETKRDLLEEANPGKIVGSVGNTSATGNSLGFIALAQEVLPALKKRLSDTPFEIHIFGGRQPKAFIKPLLNDTHIKMRGFVDDLDAEIMSAPVFLISNNHHTFKVGHTRFLHAWSLGACVVAFADCRESMPEIQHGVNALLGTSAQEVADLVAHALSDKNLRRRIGRGGVETLSTLFAPQTVTRQLITHMAGAMQMESTFS